MKQYILLLLLIGLTISCAKLDYPPSDSLTTEELLNTPNGLEIITNGNYSLFKDGIEFNGVLDDNNSYLRQYFQMSDFAADDIVCGQVTEDPLYYSFTYTHSPSQANARYFWYASYKIISGANTVINYLENKSNLNDNEKQFLGENYFLRGFVTFSLVKFYAYQYNIGDPNANLGVVLRLSTSEPKEKSRSSVAETYSQVIEDLTTAANLMNTSRGKEYASKEAAWALLSRVYLYMNNYNKVIEYADRVINSGIFNLETSANFPNYYTNTLGSNETIWAIAFTPADNKGKFGSIASMIYSDGNSGWGEEFATYDYMDLLSNNDVRKSLIEPKLDASGDVELKNGLEIYYIKKFSYQDGDPNLSSPVMLRLAEVYLNRAEAKAQLNDEAGALSDINHIRENRGLANELITAVPAGETIVDVVLRERRLELAFEGHRLFDLLRNHQNIVRHYWGYHIPGLNIGDIDLDNPPTSGYDNLDINYDSPRVLYYIPIDEILTNSLCEQNQ